MYCDHNLLTCLPEFPQNLQLLNCDHNQLTSLPPFNLNLELINCSMNKLTQFPQFNIYLMNIYCQHNQITYFPRFNTSLEVLHCYDNLLTNLPPSPPYLYELYCYDNPVDKILNSCQHNIDIVNYRSLQLYNFKKFWFQLKLKPKFRDWLWIRIREPKIRVKYSTENLLKLLENEDLEKVLETW